jgi:SAM-dependent methyltransferase
MTTEPPPIFDRALYVDRVKRARLNGPDILSQTIATELADRLAIMTRRFDNVCIIAPDPRAIADAVRKTGRTGAIRTLDVSPGDDLEIETQIFDAVFSILDLHAVNDVPGQLLQMHRALKPDGLFLGCLFAGDTLGELRQSWLAAEVRLRGGASPRVAPMIGLRDLGALLQRAGFALPVADLDRTIVRYADAISLIHEIRQLGMSNNLVARSRSPVTPSLLGAAAAHYHDHFADADGRVRATLEVAWLTGWSPHASQQKPLTPGTARMRLADALRIPESRLKADRSGAE